MTGWTSIQYTKRVTEVSRKLEALASRVDEDDSVLAAALRELHYEIEDATDTFVFGRPLTNRRRELV